MELVWDKIIKQGQGSEDSAIENMSNTSSKESRVNYLGCDGAGIRIKE